MMFQAKPIALCRTVTALSTLGMLGHNGMLSSGVNVQNLVEISRVEE